MPYKTRYTIPPALYNLMVVLIFFAVITSPFYYQPFSGLLIKTVNSQTGNAVAFLILAWTFVSFLAALGIMDVICYLLPFKKEKLS